MTEGIKIRAQIDSESVRNVMLANSGGSVALLALLPNILYTPLVVAVLSTLSVWLVGLSFAVIHSVLRRKTSLLYENKGMSPHAGERVLGIQPKEPWIGWWSWKSLYGSIVCFILGGVIMVVLSFANIEQLTNESFKSSFQQTTAESVQ